MRSRKLLEHPVQVDSLFTGVVNEENKAKFFAIYNMLNISNIGYAIKVEIFASGSFQSYHFVRH